jgi:hypothetical protein
MGRQSLNLRRVRARKRAARQERCLTWRVGPQYLDFEGAFRDLKKQMFGNNEFAGARLDCETTWME